MSDANSNPAEIERNLDRTRARLNRNLETLEDRLSPDRLMDQAVEYLRSGQGAAFTRNLGASIRENPLPAAITGIGLAWLMASGGRQQTYSGSGTYRGVSPAGLYGSRHHLHERAHQAGLAVTRADHDSDETHRDRMDDARASVLGIRRKASESSQAFSTRIQDAMDAAKEWVSDSASHLQDQANGLGDRLHDARDRVSGASGSMQGTAQDWAGSASDMMDRGRQRSNDMMGALTGNPLLMGALAVTAGAVIGVLLPETSTEHQYLGAAGERARGTLRDAAQDAVHRGQTAVQAGMDAARDSAKDAGFSTGQSASDLTAKARTVAEAALSAGKDAAQKS